MESVCGLTTWFPTSQYHVSMFAAYLFTSGYAAATISTNVSIIGYYHKLFAVSDPTTTFAIKKLLHGIAKLRPATDRRQPITRDMLRRLVWATEGVSEDAYQQKLLSAMYTLAFHGFLRISEFTTSTSNQHTLAVDNISPTKQGIRISFTSFKHHHGQPISIEINGTDHPCPVRCLLEYLKLRPAGPGQLFLHRNASPVAQTYFRAQLKACLQLAGYQSATIKSHSFRIGAATEAATRGLSNDQIQRMGRWRSTAFLRYVRIPSLPASM